MSEYIPDRWVILYITSDTEPPIRRIFAGWTGSYSYGASWKASSGITETLEFDDRYEFINYSWSKYICYKKRYCMTGYMTSDYEYWTNQLQDDMTITIEENPSGQNASPLH